MSSGQLRAIVLGVIALLCAWGVSELLSRRSDTTTATLSLGVPAVAQVDAVTITKGADTVALVKGPSGSWSVNGLAAATPRVNELLQALRDSTTPELAAESPSSFQRMGVDSAAGRSLRVASGGKTLATVIVGNRGATPDAAYVRVPGDSRVYLWRGGLAGYAERKLDDWRDREVAPVPTDSIASLDIRRGKERYTLERSGATWTLPGRRPTDSSAVALLLGTLHNLSAVGFATDRQVDSLKHARPQRSLTLKRAGGAVLLDLVFDSTSGAFWARRADQPTVYRLDFWQVDRITPSASTLARPTK